MFRFALASLALIAASSAAFANDDILRITVDQAQVAKMPENAKTIIIGNPMIADVTSLPGKAGMIVTGKGYGRTNMIALDAEGNLIDEKEIHVTPTKNVLVVQRGNTRESYSCDPKCMPTAVLGDDAGIFGATSGQVQAHDAFAGHGATK